jgi:diadenosine tetraphosphatase ApaH/serine/threonine PP2A family protein phosphatase
MRYLVLSDIHANLEALDAVLEAARDIPYERLLVLGDLIGYGASPNEVVDRVRELAPHTVIRGNHDKVGAGLEPSDAFNAVARTAIRWTYEALSDDNRDWLAELPTGPVVIDDLLEVCHGTPQDEDMYVFDDGDVLRSMQAATRRLCLFGHTHVQVGYRLANQSLTLETADLRRPLHIPISHGHYLINPGSVGQPRDGDPRAAFGVYDAQAQAVEIYRTHYPIERTQARIREAGLPEALAQRLMIGR